ncbi:MAG TPA: MFS transporter [Bryobacteraceae bacterium]|nr:MFS transporter [Bryobacteraceae bacterium]
MSRNREAATGMTAAQWTLLAMLIASIFLNYIDRSNLSLAVPSIEHEFSLSPIQTGRMLGAFFWTYALLQLFGIAGWFADRFSVSLILGAGLFLWSVATVMTGFAATLSGIIAARLLLGAGESVAYPCYSRIFASDIPAHSRGKANALLDAGSKLGPAVGTALGGFLLTQFGWRNLFIVLGVAGILWLVPWFQWSSRAGASCAAPSGLCPGFQQILRQRSAWGTFLGHFCGNYFWFFLLTWLPDYLVKERGFTMGVTVRITSLAFLTIATATLIAGWVSDRLIAAGISQTRVRKSVVVCGLAFSTVILPVAVVHNQTIAVTLLLLSCASFGTFTSNHWAITQTLAGPLAAGRWTSLQNGIGNLSGVAASWLTGFVVEHTLSFAMAFVVAAVIVLAGALLWGLAVGPVQQVQWAERELVV